MPGTKRGRSGRPPAEGIKPKSTSKAAGGGEDEVRKQRRLMRNRQSAALHRERQRALVEGLYGRVSALQAERDALRAELARVAAGGVPVALPPLAVLPPLVPECDLAAGVDPDGLDSASQLTAILRSSKTLSLPPKLTAPVAAPTAAAQRTPVVAGPQLAVTGTWARASPAPASLQGGSAASDPAGSDRGTAAGSSDDEGCAASVAGSAGSGPAEAPPAPPARADVIFASQFPTRDALGEDALLYGADSDEEGGGQGAEDEDGDAFLPLPLAHAAVVAVGGQPLPAPWAPAPLDAPEGAGDVHADGVPTGGAFSVDAALAPAVGAARNPALVGTPAGSGSSPLLTSLAVMAVLAVLAGPTLLGGPDDAAHAALAQLSGLADSAGGLLEAVASPSALPLLSGLGLLTQSALAPRPAAPAPAPALTAGFKPGALEELASQAAALAAPADVRSVAVRAPPAPAHAPGGERRLTSLTVAKPLAPPSAPEGGAGEDATPTPLTLGAADEARVMALMALLRPLFAGEEGAADALRSGLRGGKAPLVSGTSLQAWLANRGEGGDVSVLTQLPLLHAPGVPQPVPPPAPAAQSDSRGLVPYTTQYPPTALLPDASGSIARLQLFRLGLMFGTLHGIEAADAGAWAGVTPAWSLVEASAVQQLALVLAALPAEGAPPSSSGNGSWHALARAAVALRPRVDSALAGVVDKDAAAGGAPSDASNAGQSLTALMLGRAAGGNGTAVPLRAAA